MKIATYTLAILKVLELFRRMQLPPGQGDFKKHM